MPAEAPTSGCDALLQVDFRLNPISRLDEVEALWRGLERRGSGSVFVSWLWIGTWLAALPNRIRPFLLTATCHEEVCGAAILIPRIGREFAWRSRDLHFNSTGEGSLDGITIEHNGFVGPLETVKTLWPPLLQWFARQSDFERLIVPGIFRQPINVAGTNLFSNERPSPAYASSLPLNGNRDAIASAISRNSRQQLRRNLRTFESVGPLRCERADTVETALLWFQALKELHIESWTNRNKRHSFHNPFFETFHREVIARGVGQGTVDLLRISAGTSALGYLYNFRDGGRIIAYQSGVDQKMRHNRPGYVAHLLAMELCAQTGATHYDFLAGDNQLKRTFASERYAMSSWTFARKTLAARLTHTARVVSKRLRS